MIKKVSAVILAGVLAVGVLSLAGCADNSKELIEESLTNQLDTFKNKDDSALSQIASVAEDNGLSQMGIDNQEFAAAVLDGFDYTIDNITVDGNTAKADLTIISKSKSDFENKLNEAVETITNDPNLANMTQEEALNSLGDKVIEVFNNTEIITENVTIDYKLENDVWEPVGGDASLAGLDSIVFAQ